MSFRFYKESLALLTIVGTRVEVEQFEMTFYYTWAISFLFV